jgi:hypothetical protein
MNAAGKAKESAAVWPRKENSSLERTRTQTLEGALGDAKNAAVRRSHRSRPVARFSFSLRLQSGFATPTETPQGLRLCAA